MICLAMIARNEAHIITEALESVRDLIDTWCIVDTGSDDGTQEVVRAWFDEAGVPGQLHERPWVDFGTNRTEALVLARPMAEWTLMLDADDILVGSPDLTVLEADAYLLRIGAGFTYWRTQLFRNTVRWEYRGILHEYPICAESCREPVRLEGDYHIESRRLGDRNRSADKYQRDSEILRSELEREPDDARTVFYLAQSRLDAGDASEAYELYTRRTAMGGWAEEIFYSHLQRARALERLGVEWQQVLAVFLEAWQSRPTRAEPLVEIARHYRSTDEWDLAHLFASRATEIPFPDDDLLFVSRDAHTWQATDERSIAAFYLGRFDESFELTTDLLNGCDLPLEQRERVLSNRSFSIAHRRPGLSPTVEIDGLVQRRSAPIADPKITLTITTCRRRELFERTIDSFLSMCRDVERIDRWICIDDGSSAADRETMQSKYPFFEFVWKDPEDKGHAKSMEILRSMVTSTWWVHLEDDWEFFAPDHHITRAIAILEDDPALGQVLLNRNYAETIEDLRIPGGELRRTTLGGHPYRAHTHHVPGTPDYDRFTADVAQGEASNAWWPHFSLRPSVLRTEAVATVGSFDPDAVHFELDFAQRYTDAGWRSAFFDTIGCLHIGPLTSDRGAGRRPNAYDLNDEPQFGRQVAECGRWNGLRPTPDDDVEAAFVDRVIGMRRFDALPIHTINLDRRPDRWNSFIERLHSSTDPATAAKFDRVAGIDGMTLERTSEIEHLFRGNDFDFRRGLIGCALTHLDLWQRIAEGDAEMALICEDDVSLVPDFTHRFVDALSRLPDADCFDLAFLGSQQWPDAPDRDSVVAREIWRPMVWEDYLGGTFAYLVTSVGARRLLSLVERDGIQTGIDWFPMRHAAEVRALECLPALASSPLAWPGRSGDSDIQHDLASISHRSDATAGEKRTN